MTQLLPSLKFLVLDEYADMKPDVFEQILRPALADQKGCAMFIGTPMGRNHFYELYKYAEIDDDPTYKAWHFTSYDNPLLDPDEIDMAKKSMSSYAFRQEFMASFEAISISSGSSNGLSRSKVVCSVRRIIA